MKKILLSFLIISSLLSCKKLNNPTQDSNFQKGKISQKPKMLSAGDGNWDLLGYGYDVTGQYANSESSTWPIIDVVKFKAEHPTYIDQSGAETGTYYFEAGQDAEDFSMKLTNKTTLTGGAEKLFAGTINFNFSVEDKWSSKYIYSTYNSISIKRRVKIIPDYALLRNYLHQGFLNHVQTLTAQQLVNRYGTHVLSDIKLGGKLELIYQAQTNSLNRTLAAGAGAKFTFTKIFGLATEGSYNSSLAQSNFNEKAFVRTIGGNSAAAVVNTITFNASGIPSATYNVGGWQLGVTDGNSEMIDITPGGLIPLYELISNPTKKAAVQNYIIQYLLNHKTTIFNPDWRLLPGAATDIAVSPEGSAFIIGNSGGIGYSLYKWNGTDWQDQNRSNLLRVSVDPNGNPWIIDRSLGIFRKANNNWTQLPGAATDIGIGSDGSVFIIGYSSGTGYSLFKWNGTDWVNQNRNNLLKVSVDPLGRPWVVTRSYQIWRYVNNYWLQLPGEATDICVGSDGSVYIVGNALGGYKIYKFVNGDWVELPGGNGANISAGINGVPWLTTRTQIIYKYY